MATSSVFSLTRFTALAAGDVIPAVDISDATQSAHGSLDAMTVTNFFSTIPVPVVITSTTTPQLSVNYDGTHKATFSVSSAGLLTITPTTTTAFATAVAVTGSLTATGAFAVASGQKVYLDGVAATGDTFIWENSANRIDIQTGGTTAQIITASLTTFSAGISATTGTFSGALTTTAALAVAATQKVYLDGVAATGDTYIQESSANNLVVQVGGNVAIAASATGLVFNHLTTDSIGFFANAGTSQQTVTGSRGANAALASLLTKLALYGLIVDGSS